MNEKYNLKEKIKKEFLKTLLPSFNVTVSKTLRRE